MSGPRTPANLAFSAFFEVSDVVTLRGDEGGYLAGLRDANGEPWIQLTLDEVIVETTLLARAEMAIALDHRGFVTLDPAGWSDAAVDQAHKAGYLPRISLQQLVEDAVNPEALRMEDDPAASLALLRQHLLAALALTDAAAAAMAAERARSAGCLAAK
jgi:hypothetical protein